MTGYNVALGYRIPSRVEHLRARTVQLYVEWNGTVAARDAAGDVRLPDTGGHFAYLSPGAQWVVLPQFLVEGSVQFPIVDDANGVQPDLGIRSALGFRVLFF